MANPAVMIAMFATASFRADRNAARVKLPLWRLWLARRKAQVTLIASAPKPVTLRGMAAEAMGNVNFPKQPIVLQFHEKAARQPIPCLFSLAP